jgi:hypothetical protein
MLTKLTRQVHTKFVELQMDNTTETLSLLGQLSRMTAKAEEASQ